MSDLLHEVDEIMRQERMAKLWKEHGSTLIAFIVMTIIATGAISGYRSWNMSVQEKGTAQLVALLESQDFPKNIQTADLDMRPALRGMALIQAAGALAEKAKTAEALSLYQKAASDASLPEDLSQLAGLSYVRLRVQHGGETPADLQDRLQEIWADQNSPWRYHAHLEAAVLLAADGDYAQAREHLNKIQDGENLPDTLFSKARALDQVYALKQIRSSENG